MFLLLRGLTFVNPSGCVTLTIDLLLVAILLVALNYKFGRSTEITLNFSLSGHCNGGRDEISEVYQLKVMGVVNCMWKECLD